MSRPSAYGNVLGGGLKLKGKAGPAAARPAAVAAPVVAAASAPAVVSSSSSAVIGGAGAAAVLSSSPALTGTKRKFADSEAAKSSASDVASPSDGGHKEKRREVLHPDADSDAISPGAVGVGRSASSGSASKDGAGSASKALSRSGSAEASSEAASGGAGEASSGLGAGAAAVDRRTAAQKAHDEALAKRVRGGLSCLQKAGASRSLYFTARKLGLCELSCL